MIHNDKYQIFIFLLSFIILNTSFTQLSSAQTFSSSDIQGISPFNGQILFSPYYCTTTYLTNHTGTIIHTWSSSYQPFTEAYWLGNGAILRPIISGGGGIQKILWDGSIDWDFRYTVSGCYCHHDIEYLPNGNVLMIVWETKTRNEAIAAGRDPNTIQGNTFIPDKIIEVKPTGPTSGDIVWEWHVWDHLIQDFDSSKENYGCVGDHPELININFGDPFVNDWLHTNSIDYHQEFDQILIDIHNFNEIWVIDHSTTTEEAASHSGGNSGKGGDLLYRWGNPEAYDTGTANDQKLFFQHDATWIQPGYPGEGHILVFNNGNNRPSGQYSTVDEFAPPVDSNGEYYLEPGSSYGPDDYTWSYIANPPTSFFSRVFGGAHRLKDGNTLICDGVSGRFFEVTPDKITIWEWINPYPTPTQNDVFKIDYIPEELPEPKTPDLDCTGSLSWDNVKPGETVESNFTLMNNGESSSLLNWKIESYPTWGTWDFTPKEGTNLTPEDGPITITVFVTVPNEKNAEFNDEVKIVNEENSSDYCTISVTLTTPKNQVTNLYLNIIMWLFKRFANTFPILRFLIKN